MQTRDPLFIASTAKALKVLEIFAHERGPLLIGEIAQRAGENRSSVQRSVHTLHELGYLQKEEGTRRYRPSNKCLIFADAFLRCDWLVERAAPLLMACHNECEETVNLSQLVGSEIMLISRLPSRHHVSIVMHVGARAPAYCTAPGRAILAYRPDDEVNALLQASHIEAFTPYTLTDPADIRRCLAEVREKGYAIQSQELAIGDISVAAPVRTADGRAVAAVNVAVPTARWTADRLEKEIAPLVIHTARAITNTVITRRSGDGASVA